MIVECVIASLVDNLINLSDIDLSLAALEKTGTIEEWRTQAQR